jgi:hypothetical protein
VLAVALLAGLLCGSDRRAVKMMTDPDTANVQLRRFAAESPTQLDHRHYVQPTADDRRPSE